MAIQCLRRKKAVALYQVQLDQALQNVESLLHAMRSTHDQAHILATLEGGSSALKDMLQRHAYTADRAVHIMDGVADQLQDAQDVEAAITQGHERIQDIAGGPVDELDLEAELDDMLAQDRYLAATMVTHTAMGTDVSASATTDTALLVQLAALRVHQTQEPLPEDSSKQPAVLHKPMAM